MTTDAQRAANRANACLSTGPNTPEGKARASRNARKHRRRPGELPLTLVEDEAAFAAHCDAVAAAFEPVDAFEAELVRQIALHQWRLGRVQRIEAALFDAETRRVDYHRTTSYHPASLHSRTVRPADIWPDRIGEVSRFETAIERALDRALGMLQRHRTRRAPLSNRENSPNEPNYAKEINTPA